jgi:3-deoxy-manno-octulosonate cytidylyltransferase (CMP-KDO synthetase)
VPGAVAIIPARMASTRFPGKVLAAETGRPLVLHAVDQARAAASVARVVVATDAAEVRDALAGAGVEVVMTREDHPNGTSRLAEAAHLLGLASDDLVVNVQGDEPEIDPGLIDETVRATARSGEPMGTLASPFRPGEDPSNPNIVKVVVRHGPDGVARAIYFSRAPIPHDRDGTGIAQSLKHAGLYVYRRHALDAFVAMPESPLERVEKLEQLRAVEAGWSIAVLIRPFDHVGIDTPEQYAAFVQRWRSRVKPPEPVGGTHPHLG